MNFGEKLADFDVLGADVFAGAAGDTRGGVLAMFGKAAPELRSSIRFSFGQGLTDELIAEAGQRTVEIIKRTVK